jgi:hypothetical protein
MLALDTSGLFMKNILTRWHYITNREYFTLRNLQGHHSDITHARELKAMRVKWTVSE